MADAKTEQEPSIEEILESIRQIISDDGEAPAPAPAAAAAPAPPPAAAPQPAPVPPPPAPKAEAPKPVPKPLPAPAPADDILELTEKVVHDAAGDIDLQDIAPEPAYQMSAPAADTMQGGLLSDITTDASINAMARLLAGNVAVEREMPGRVGNVTLEDMARELMRPLVKTWLDQNLPGIIEKMVAKEIERISRLAMKQ